MMDAEQIDMFTSLPTRRAVAGPTTAPLFVPEPKSRSLDPPRRRCLLLCRACQDASPADVWKEKCCTAGPVTRPGWPARVTTTPLQRHPFSPPHCLRQLPRTDAEPFNGGLDHPRKTIPTLGWSALAMCLTKIQNCTPILRRARDCKRDALSLLLELL